MRKKYVYGYSFSIPYLGAFETRDDAGIAAREERERYGNKTGPVVKVKLPIPQPKKLKARKK